MIVRIRSKSVLSSKCSSEDGSVQKRKETIQEQRCKKALKSERIRLKRHLSVFRDFLNQDKHGICMWQNHTNQIIVAEPAIELVEEEIKELEPP